MNALDGYLSLATLVAAKASILLVVAFGLGFAARKSSASTRHAVWALTFVFLLLIPGMAYVSLVQQEVSIRIPVRSSVRAPAEAKEVPIPSVSRVRDGAGYEPRLSDARSTPLHWSRVVGWSWVVGTVLLFARLGIGLLSSRRVLAESEPVLEPEWAELLSDARERMGVRGNVALRRSDRARLPLTMGLFRPAILLPLDSSDYSPSRRTAVIFHELAHVRRRDCVSQVMSQLAAGVFWWNPLIWIAALKMRVLSERASDDLVLHAGARPSEYAHDLLDMARGLKRDRATPLLSVAMAHRSRFEERLLAILDPRAARGAVSSRFVIAAGVAASPFVISLAMVAPTAAVPATPPSGVQVEELERPVPIEPAPPVQEPEEPEEPEEREQPEQASQREPRSPRSEVERAALEAAKAALGEALDDPEASVREQALHVLVQLEDHSVAPYLEKALAGPDPGARAQAAWGLGQLRREESVPGLTGALRDADEGVRSQAAWALGMIRSRASVPGLIGALSDESKDVRSQAAWALGMIRDSSAISGLTRALKDGDADVRSQAAWALGLIVLDEDEEDEDEDNPQQEPDPKPKVIPEPGAAMLRGASF
jgi:beta-lactamase regulating signal transducer with metallopeptidase domain